jgi:hypothetical protein
MHRGGAKRPSPVQVSRTARATTLPLWKRDFAVAHAVLGITTKLSEMGWSIADVTPGGVCSQTGVIFARNIVTESTGARSAVASGASWPCAEGNGDRGRALPATTASQAGVRLTQMIPLDFTPDMGRVAYPSHRRG